MKVELLSFTPNPVKLLEEAASTCYNSTPSEDGRIIRQCYLSGHHSVLEHAVFTFRLSGVSRALLAQLTRHRLAAFSVQSQRYVDMTGQACVVPETLSTDSEAIGAYMGALSRAQYAYGFMQEKGVPNEDARYILPNSCTTVIVMTVNLRELIHICNERLCTRAQWEIRRAVQEMVRLANEATDNAFCYMLVPKCERNPKYPFCTESKKECCGRNPRLADVYRDPRKDGAE